MSPPEHPRLVLDVVLVQGQQLAIRADRLKRVRQAHRSHQHDSEQQKTPMEQGQHHRGQEEERHEAHRGHTRPNPKLNAELRGQRAPRLASRNARLSQERGQVDGPPVDVRQVQRSRGADAPNPHGEGVEEAVERGSADLNARDFVIGKLQLLLADEGIATRHRGWAHRVGGAEGWEQRTPQEGSNPVHSYLGGPSLRGRDELCRRTAGINGGPNAQLFRFCDLFCLVFSADLLFVLPVGLGGFQPAPKDPLKLGSVGQPTKGHLRAAALTAHGHVVQAQDLIEEGLFGGCIGDVFGWNEGVGTGKEALPIFNDVVVDLVGALLHVEEVQDHVGHHPDSDQPQSRGAEQQTNRTRFCHRREHPCKRPHHKKRHPYANGEALDDHAQGVGLLAVEQLVGLHREAVGLEQRANSVVDHVGLAHRTEDHLRAAAPRRLNDDVAHVEEAIADPGEVLLDVGDVLDVELSGGVAGDPARVGDQPGVVDDVPFLAPGHVRHKHRRSHQANPERRAEQHQAREPDDVSQHDQRDREDRPSDRRAGDPIVDEGAAFWGQFGQGSAPLVPHCKRGRWRGPTCQVT